MTAQTGRCTIRAGLSIWIHVRFLLFTQQSWWIS